MNLREYLFRKKMTYTQFAEMINYNRNYVSDVANGRSNPGRKFRDIVTKATDGEVTFEENDKNSDNES